MGKDNLKNYKDEELFELEEVQELSNLNATLDRPIRNICLDLIEKGLTPKQFQKILKSADRTTEIDFNLLPVIELDWDYQALTNEPEDNILNNSGYTDEEDILDPELAITDFKRFAKPNMKELTEEEINQRKEISDKALMVFGESIYETIFKTKAINQAYDKGQEFLYEAEKKSAGTVFEGAAKAKAEAAAVKQGYIIIPTNDSTRDFDNLVDFLGVPGSSSGTVKSNVKLFNYYYGSDIKKAKYSEEDYSELLAMRQAEVINKRMKELAKIDFERFNGISDKDLVDNWKDYSAALKAFGGMDHVLNELHKDNKFIDKELAKQLLDANEKYAPVFEVNSAKMRVIANPYYAKYDTKPFESITDTELRFTDQIATDFQSKRFLKECKALHDASDNLLTAQRQALEKAEREAKEAEMRKEREAAFLKMEENHGMVILRDVVPDNYKLKDLKWVATRKAYDAIYDGKGNKLEMDWLEVGKAAVEQSRLIFVVKGQPDPFVIDIGEPQEGEKSPASTIPEMTPELKEQLRMIRFETKLDNIAQSHESKEMKELQSSIVEKEYELGIIARSLKAFPDNRQDLERHMADYLAKVTVCEMKKKLGWEGDTVPITDEVMDKYAQDLQKSSIVKLVTDKILKDPNGFEYIDAKDVYQTMVDQTPAANKLDKEMKQAVKAEGQPEKQEAKPEKQNQMGSL